uniref:Defensin-like protein 296 n=1 Tax=Nicotiana sylvestris TaxID=4096 RepID=A0A1U7Y2Y5_NICSY|nr:PREDICTED: defensin-like protein 296 [Nicotiana sylvestris]
MAKTLLTLFMVVTLLIVSRDGVTCETSCQTIRDCRFLPCYPNFVGCIGGKCVCKDPPPGTVMCVGTFDCGRFMKCNVGSPICVKQTCICSN